VEHLLRGIYCANNLPNVEKCQGIRMRCTIWSLNTSALVSPENTPGIAIAGDNRRIGVETRCKTMIAAAATVKCGVLRVGMGVRQGNPGKTGLHAKLRVFGWGRITPHFGRGFHPLFYPSIPSQSLVIQWGRGSLVLALGDILVLIDAKNRLVLVE
jgi:hypothetical protein